MGHGPNSERELASRGWKHGYATLRAPGSGSIDRPSPDVVLIKAVYRRDYGVYEKYLDTHVVAVELKNNPDGTAHFDKHEIKELNEWAERADADAYAGIKPDMRKHDSWYFIPTVMLNETNKGYSIRKKDHENAKCLQQILK